MKKQEEHVYRLHVSYPEGADLKEDCFVIPEGIIQGWPKVKRYLTFAGARARAELLAQCGAVVYIETSDPVTWRSR